MSNDLKSVSFVDSTLRHRWEVNKADFDNCEIFNKLKSSNFTVQMVTEQSEWYIQIYPRGDEEAARNSVVIYLNLNSKDKIYQVRVHFAIETENGYWPDNFKDRMYSRGISPKTDKGDLHTFKAEFNGTRNHKGKHSAWGIGFCSTEEFTEKFIGDKVTLVTSLVIYVEEGSDHNKMDLADNFTDDMRAIPSLSNLSDFTLTCGDRRFPCHKLVLAARSKYFEAMFRNNETKKELVVKESTPEVIEAVVEYMSKGVIPKDMDALAIDLIQVADMYELDLLTKSCENSLVNNLSPENVLETLVIFDKLKHVTNSENKQKILAFIKKEASKIVKTDDWKKFILNYPDLVTDIVFYMTD